MKGVVRGNVIVRNLLSGLLTVPEVEIFLLNSVYPICGSWRMTVTAEEIVRISEAHVFPRKEYKL
jgi:hypothetical protein